MKQRRRYKYLKRLRKWRDEVIGCENLGRITHLIVHHPKIHKVRTETGMTNHITVILYDGYEFYAKNFWMRPAVHEVVMEVYFHLIKINYENN